MQENEKSTLEKRAKSAALSRDFTMAERLYKSLLKDEPDNIEYLSALGSVYMQKGEDEKALPYFTHLLSIEPDNFSALNNTGAIYRRLKRYDESLEVLQKASDLGIKNTQLDYNIGFTYKEMAKYDEAIERFESVIIENPRDVLAFNHLASIHAARHDYEHAVSVYNRGLQVDPNHPILLYNLAHSYIALGKTDGAMRAFESALRYKPGWLEATYDYMDLLVKQNKNKAAVDLINKTLSLYPNDAKLKQRLGHIMLSQMDFDNAIKVFEDARTLDGNDTQALSALADAYEKAERAADALPIMDKLEKNNPADIDIQKQFAHILLSARELDNAGIRIKKMYSDNETDIQILDLYGQYYICQKDEDSAQWFFQKINSIDNKYDNHINEAAERYRQNGWLDKAEKYAQDYLSRHTDDAEAYNLLGRIQEAKGNTDAALNSFKHSLRHSPDNSIAKNAIARINGQEDETPQVAEQNIYNEEREEVIDTPEINAVAQQEDEDASDVDVEKVEPAQVEQPTQPSEAEEEFNFDMLGAESDDEFNAEDVFDFDADFNAEELEDDKPLKDLAGLISESSPYDTMPRDDLSIATQENSADDMFADEDIRTINSINHMPKVLKSIPMESEEMRAETPPPPVMPQPYVQPVSAQPLAPAPMPRGDYYAPPAYNGEIDQKLDDAIYKARSSADKALEAAERAEAAHAAAASALEASVEAAKAATEEAADLATEAMRAAAEEAVSATIRVAEEAAEAAEKSAEQAAKIAADAATMEVMQKMQSLLDEQKFAETEASVEENSVSMLDTASRLLPDVIAMLSQKQNVEEYKHLLLLFEKIKTVMATMPSEVQQEFVSSKVRLQLEYIISKLSGRPGLIATVDALNEAIAEKTGQDKSPLESSGGEQFASNMEAAEAVIAELGILAMSLDDKTLAQALAEIADDVLQKF